LIYGEKAPTSWLLGEDKDEGEIENEEGWVSLKREADVDAINFEVQEFYELADPEKTAELRQAIQDDVDKRKANNKLAKEAEKAEKAARDADRAAKKAKAETTTTA
jgi:hypothetical protein